MKDRKLTLLKRFILSDFPVSLQSLSHDFQLSQRTIRNEISELNCYLSESELPSITTIRGKGLNLSLTDLQRTKLICLLEKRETGFLSREERIFDLILAIAFGKEKVFLYKKEAEYQISKSTLDEDMRRLRELLKQYKLCVVSIPKQGLVFTGKEKIIRTMLYSLINEGIEQFSFEEKLENYSTKQRIVFRYIPVRLFKAIDTLYDRRISASEESFYRKNLILFTGIWLTRCSQGAYIPENGWTTRNYAVSENIQQFVEDVFNQLIQLSVSRERSYLLFMLDTFNPKDMNNSIDWVLAQMLSLQLIQHVEQWTDIPFSRREEALQEGLYKHITGLLNRMRYDIQFANPLKENIKNNYGALYQAVQDFSLEINQAVGKEITEDELAFLTIHFSTSVSELNQQEAFYHRIVVICNHGTATGKLLAENLKELFSIEVLAVLSSREIQLIEKLDVDLVFTTLPVPIKDKPFLMIEPIIKAETKRMIADFLKRNTASRRQIRQTNDSTQLFHDLLSWIGKQTGKVTKESYDELEYVFQNNHLSLNKKEIQPMIKDILKDENIIVNAKAADWEQAIKLTAEPLLRTCSINEAYVRAMIDAVKEYGPYIVIGPHMALAHARPEDGAEKLGLSVATLKEPVVFGHEDNDPVNIIFCLSAVDSYSHLNIMKNLIDLINNEVKLKKLTEAQTIKDFRNVLLEE